MPNNSKRVNLSKSLEDYLEAIYIFELQEEKIMPIEIAHFLNVSKPAVSQAMDKIQELGYISREKYGDITLLACGRKKAKEVYHKHLIIHDFLCQLGVDEQTANRDCCLIEHIISQETLQAFEKALKKDNRN